MVKAKEQELILLKYALALTRLMNLNDQKEYEGKSQRGKKQRVTKLGQLSVDTELRPATLSNIFLGRSNLKATTIIQILKSLGRTYTEFAEQFDHISDKEILEFKNHVDNLKKERGRPTKKKK